MRRSERVTFAGGSGGILSGIIDLPSEDPHSVAVFTHCFTCNKDLKAIVRVCRGLAASGTAVLRYDLTGLGNSEGDFSQTNFSTNRKDLFAAHAFLSEHLRAPEFLLGHSFGGACSLSVAGELNSVRGVVSLASPSDTEHLAGLLARMNPAIESDGHGSVWIGGREYLIRREMLEDFRHYDLAAKLRYLDKPCLLMHSPIDETLGYEHVLRLFGLLTNRDDEKNKPSPTSLICLDGADHLLTKNPADWELIVETATAWFRRLNATREQ